jgi:hypothetical protein
VATVRYPADKIGREQLSYHQTFPERRCAVRSFGRCKSIECFDLKSGEFTAICFKRGMSVAIRPLKLSRNPTVSYRSKIKLTL